MDKEIIIEYKFGKKKDEVRKYTQVLLPVRQAIMLRTKWTNKDGTIDDITMYEEVLKNMFDKEYKLEDFGYNLDEVDHIVQTAVINQYAPSGK